MSWYFKSTSKLSNGAWLKKTALISIVTFGSHCTGYVEDKSGLRIQAPGRARTKLSNGGTPDNTAARGMAMRDVGFTMLVKEALEEASWLAEIAREKAQACGTDSYFHIQAK